MRRICIWLTLLAGEVAGGEAVAACRASASGARSFETRLTPGPARVCRMTVDVFDGGTCGGAPRWSALLPCDQTKNLAISERGRLISILAPVVKRRDLNILRVTWRADRWAWVPLEKLQLAAGHPLKLPVRLSFEGDALKVVSDRAAVIPFEAVRQMASALGD